MAGTLSSPLSSAGLAELAALDAALRRAEGGTPAIVLIGGDAGLGKTRLVDRVRRRPRGESGARVLIGGCLDLGGEGLPYGPFLEALRALGRELPPDDLRELLGDVGPELVAVAPGFARFLDARDEGTAPRRRRCRPPRRRPAARRPGPAVRADPRPRRPPEQRPAAGRSSSRTCIGAIPRPATCSGSSPETSPQGRVVVVGTFRYGRPRSAATRCWSRLAELTRPRM